MVAHAIPPAERIQAYSVIDPESGCWRWTKHISVQGYASIKAYGRTRAAHAVSYECFVGPIPEGMQIDHVCHSRDLTCAGGASCLHRRCVNPQHLEAVTPAVNVQRGRNDPRASMAAYHQSRLNRPACPRGHEWTEENTRQGNGQRFCRACQRENMAAYRANQPPVAPKPRQKATHCRNGHQYTEANTYERQGVRFCRACRRRAAADLRKRKRES